MEKLKKPKKAKKLLKSSIFAQICVFILSLYIVIGTVPVAYAENPTNWSPQEIAFMRFRREQEIHQTNMRVIREGGQVEGYGGYKGTQVALSGKQPITVVNAATNSTVAVLEAEVEKKALISPAATQMAKTVARGVGWQLIGYGVFKLIDKMVDYVLDPTNTKVQYKEKVGGLCDMPGVNRYDTPFDDSMKARCGGRSYGYRLFTNPGSEPVGYEYQCGTTDNNFTGWRDSIIYCQTKQEEVQKELPLTDVMQAAKDVASDPKSPNSQAASNALDQVVGDMVTNNEIDNSYFNDAGSVDNSTEVINNFITNNYPNSNLGFSTSKGADGHTTIVPGANTQVTNNGDTTTYSTTNNTTNNNNTTTTTTTQTTVNNTTNNITNVTITNQTTNNTTNTTPQNPTSSTEATSSPAQTSAPGKTSAPAPTKQDESKPFEFPAFCDWAKPVCDFIDWFKKDDLPPDETPKPPKDGTLADVGLENIDRFQMRIKFPAACPSQNLTFNLFGRTYSHAIPYEPVCEVLDIIAPVLVGVACLGVAFYIVREI